MKNSSKIIIGLIVAAAVGGGAWYFINLKKRKLSAAGFAMHNTQQAAVLASQMATMVENTRALVDANAAASSQQLQSAITAMNERLQNLEKMGWEGAGKEKYSDPALVNLVEQVRLLTSGAATNTGKGMGANALWGYIVGGIGLLALVIDLVSRLSVK